jgi:lipopolysaccharide assembly outer membrane protein LptD (OstA)
MQPPQSSALAQGIRQGTPQQQLQLPQQGAQGLRATPPRPSNLSPTGAHFTPGPNPLNLQTVLQFVQQNNPQLSVAEATKLAVEHISRLNLQQESMRNTPANGLMQQHLQQQLAKSSPTASNQQIRRSPSQTTNTPHSQGQQRMQ